MKKYFLWIGIICLFQLHSREDSLPKIAILTCSDLNVSPSQIFSSPSRDFFIVRSSGNVLDDVNQASLEFGVEIFDISTLIVLTHSNCEAVQGAIKTAFEHLPAEPKSMSVIYSKIEPSLKVLADKEILDSEDLDRASKENALNQLKDLIKSSKAIRQKIKKKTLQASAAFFNQKTNQLEFLDQ